MFGDQRFAVVDPRACSSIPVHLRDNDRMYGSFNTYLQAFGFKMFNVGAGTQCSTLINSLTSTVAIWVQLKSILVKPSFVIFLTSEHSDAQP